MSVAAGMTVLGMIVIGAPAVLLAVQGLAPLVGLRLSERAIARWTSCCVACGLAAIVLILGVMLWTGSREVPLELGDWVTIEQEHFHFHIKFVFDRLSMPFAVLTFVLVGTVGAFADRYLHQDAGYGRFFLSFSFFLLGMVTAALAGTIETLFLGWELVGLSSALLVAYFQERKAPVINAQRIWSVYRISDAAFLIAALVLHHVSGGGEFSRMMGSGPWPMGEAALTSGQALGVGMLLLVAAAGKSGLIPFSGWMPRAMEGPTPSSAVFYGALSVHLGTFLLLRVSPILELSVWLAAVVTVLGLATAVFASMTGRVQTDAKCALAYASLTQVGIITAEIGMGLRYIPLIHMIGHACLRTLQLLRSPSLLRDYHDLENALGGHLEHRGKLARVLGSEGAWRRFYRMGLERGQLDALLDRYVARPFVRIFQWCDHQERRWGVFLENVGSSRARQGATVADEPIMARGKEEAR